MPTWQPLSTAHAADFQTADLARFVSGGLLPETWLYTRLRIDVIASVS